MNNSELQTRFDYSVIQPEHRQFIQQQATEIGSLLHRSAEDIWDIGKRLNEVKDRVGYGNFTAWIHGEFDMSPQSARNFMLVYDQFKNTNFVNLNIKPSVLYELASGTVSDELRGEVIERAKAGENITLAKVKELKLDTAEEELSLLYPTAPLEPHTVPLPPKKKAQSKVPGKARFSYKEKRVNPEPSTSALRAAKAVLADRRNHKNTDTAIIEIARLIDREMACSDTSHDIL